MQEQFSALHDSWRLRGHALGLGIGVSSGYATIGALGYGDRWQYSATGPVINLAARLCADAQHGEVLASSQVPVPLGNRVKVRTLGERPIRGFQRPIVVSAVESLTTASL